MWLFLNLVHIIVSLKTLYHWWFSLTGIVDYVIFILISVWFAATKTHKIVYSSNCYLILSVHIQVIQLKTWLNIRVNTIMHMIHKKPMSTVYIKKWQIDHEPSTNPEVNDFYSFFTAFLWPPLLALVRGSTYRPSQLPMPCVLSENSRIFIQNLSRLFNILRHVGHD